MMDPSELDTPTLVMLLAGQLRERVRSHPLSTLAGAASIGYMIGWSMPTALYRAVASMAMRSVALQLVSTVLHSGDDDDDDALLLEEEDDEDLDRPARSDRRQADAPPYVA